MEISDLEQFGHSTPRGFKRALHKLENMAQQKTQSGLINSNAEVDGNLLITEFFPIHTCSVTGVLVVFAILLTACFLYKMCRKEYF